MVVQASSTSYFCDIHAKIYSFCILRIMDSELLLQPHKVSRLLPNYTFQKEKKIKA